MSVGCVVCGMAVEGPVGSACARCEAQPPLRVPPIWVSVATSLPPWVLVLGIWLAPYAPHHWRLAQVPYIVAINLAWSIWAATFAARYPGPPAGAIVGGVSAAGSIVMLFVALALS